MGNLMGKLLRKSCKEEESNAMENLWQKLPNELQFGIVMKLSAENLCRLRLTCKYFYSLLSVQSFSIDYDRFHHAHSTILVSSMLCWGGRGFGNDELYFCLEEKDAMSTARSRWQKRLCHVPKSEVAHLWASGDGFLCFKSSQWASKWLVVNPLFPCDRCILSVPSYEKPSWLRGIAFDRKNGIFKLVLHSSSTTFVYNFKNKMWKIIEKGPVWEGLEQYVVRFNGVPTIVNDLEQYSVEFNGFPTNVSKRFLCWQVMRPRTIPYIEVDAVVVFDVEEESWVETIPMDKKLFKAVCIAEHEEQLCAIGKTRENGVIVLKLWKFDMENRRWSPSERLRAPPFPLQETDRIFGGRELVWLIKSEEKDFGREMSVWIYDLTCHSWRKHATFQCTRSEIPELPLVQLQCFEGSLFRLRGNFSISLLHLYLSRIRGIFQNLMAGKRLENN